jgi:hypothetical protein
MVAVNIKAAEPALPALTAATRRAVTSPHQAVEMPKDSGIRSSTGYSARRWSPSS